MMSLKKVLDLSFIKNTNGNLRLGPNDNEHEGSVQSSYLPELWYLQQLFLVQTAEIPSLRWLLFLITAGCMVYNSFLHVWKVCVSDLVQGQWMLKLIETVREKLWAILSFPLPCCSFFICLHSARQNLLAPPRELRAQGADPIWSVSRLSPPQSWGPTGFNWIMRVMLTCHWVGDQCN